MKSRLVSLGMALLTLLMATVPIGLVMAERVSGDDFKDVSPASSHYMAIMYLKSHGVVEGYADGTFKPDQLINRVEALKLILQPSFKHWEKTDGAFMAGASTPVSFKDTDSKAWYWRYVQSGYDNGLVQGYPDGTFRPDALVNKAENLKMLMSRYFQDDMAKLDTFVAAKSSFADVSTNDWFDKYFEAAWALKVVNGVQEGQGDAAVVKIFPAANLTRGEFAEMVYRLMKMDEDELAFFVPEAVFFSTSTTAVTVEKKTVPFSQLYTVQRLKDMAAECGSSHAAGYFENLYTTFKDSKAVTYDMYAASASKTTPGVEVYTLTTLTNLPGYNDLAAFKNDFDVCAAGGSYPRMAGKSFLVMSGSCGGAVDGNVASPVCGEIKEMVEDTLRFSPYYEE